MFLNNRSTFSPYLSCDLLILNGRVDTKAAPAFELAVLKVFDNKRYKIVLNLPMSAS